MSPWKHGRAWFLPLAIGILALGPPGWAEVVRPEVHRTADEGFFRIQVPADAQHATAAGLLARVDQGDAYLIQLDSGAPEGSSVPSQPRQLALLGRFLRPGPVRITLLARSPEGSPQAWKSLEFCKPMFPWGHSSRQRFFPNKGFSKSLVNLIAPLERGPVFVPVILK